MNDDIEGAEKGLEHGNSSFHKLGKGIVMFLRAALGFEQDVMREASEKLNDAESSAAADQARAERDSRAYRSEIYAPGSEFALCQAESQIMSAVVAVLNESLTESLRGFYKLRKAFMTLDSLQQMEDNYIKAHEPSANSAQVSPESLRSATSPGSVKSNAVHQPSALRQSQNAADLKALNIDDTDSDDDEFYEAAEVEKPRVTQGYSGKISKPDTTNSEKANGHISKADLSKHNAFESKEVSGQSLPSIRKVSNIGKQATTQGSEIFTTPQDIFIHSGVGLCFGMLLLMLSIIPPSFSKLLYIIGFRGDRERGMRLLWEASQYDNVNGGLAGQIILGWHNGVIGFCDIVPDTHPSPDGVGEIPGYPEEKLKSLLGEMRRKYPDSSMWLLEEARMAAGDRDLERALALLDKPPKAQLKQIEALNWFERGLNAMYAHEFELCAKCFIKCVDLNSWSRALYYYIAGACHLMQYRDSVSIDDAKAGAKHGKLAEEYFKTATTHVGKKKMMGRQLPFDSFVTRKIQKWTARSEAWKCSFVDAVGVSPLEEMIYFWNGYKKMSTKYLTNSLAHLSWSEDLEKNPRWSQEDLDEHSILYLLRASVLRNMRRHSDAKSLLNDKILCHEPQAFKGHLKDDWTQPTAHYEVAVNLWMERTDYIRLQGALLEDATSEDIKRSEAERAQQNPASDKDLVSEAKVHVEKAKNWGSFDLDARIGMKLTAGLDAINKWETKHR